MGELKISHPGGQLSAGEDEVEGRADAAAHELVVAEGEGADSFKATIEAWFPSRAAAGGVEADLHSGDAIGVAHRSREALAQDIGVVPGIDADDPAFADFDPDIPEVNPAVECVVGVEQAVRRLCHGQEGDEA